MYKRQGLYTDADVCASTYKSVNSDADLQSRNDVKCQFSDAAVSMTGFRGDGMMSTEVGRDPLEVRVDEFRDKMIDASLLTRDDPSGPAVRDVDMRGKDGRSSQDSATDGQRRSTSNLKDEHKLSVFHNGKFCHNSTVADACRDDVYHTYLSGNDDRRHSSCLLYTSPSPRD